MNIEIVNENIRELNRKLKNLRNERNEMDIEITEMEKIRKEIFEYINHLENQIIKTNGIVYLKFFFLKIFLRIF